MRILAVDPGYGRLGIAILENLNGKTEVLFSSCLTTKKNESSVTRLQVLGGAIEKIIKKYRPEALAIETLFFEKNQKTAMGVAEARGMVIYLAGKSNMEVFEYLPNQIKLAVTSYGRSDKRQVIEMVKRLVDFNKPKALDDEYDAIAVGLTHLAIHKINWPKALVDWFHRICTV